MPALFETKTFCKHCRTNKDKQQRKKVLMWEKVEIYSLLPQLAYVPYRRITSKRVWKHGLARWRVDSLGFFCPKCGATQKMVYRRGYTLNQVKQRLSFSSYRVKNITLFYYNVNWLAPNPKDRAVPEFAETFTGVLWSTTPRLKVDAQLLSAVERIMLDKEYVVVTKSHEGLVNKQFYFLVDVHDFRALRRLESRQKPVEFFHKKTSLPA